MPIFAKPPDPRKSIVLKHKAPWLNRANTYEALPDRMDDFGGLVSTGRDPSKSAKTLLNFAQFSLIPMNVMAFGSVIPGLILIATALPGKHGRKAHPLIANSSIVSILVGVVLIAVAYYIWHIVAKVSRVRNEIFKRDIVRMRLQTCFGITDYVYNESEDGQPVLEKFLNSLKIKDGCWNRFHYNDYFRGTYQNTPFVFLDCDLINHVNSGKNGSDYTVFKGQVILLESCEKLTNADKAFRTTIYPQKSDGYFGSHLEKLTIEQCYPIEDVLNKLLSGKAFLSGGGVANEVGLKHYRNPDGVSVLGSQIDRKTEELQRVSDELSEAEQHNDTLAVNKKMAEASALMDELVKLNRRYMSAMGVRADVPEKDDVDEKMDGSDFDWNSASSRSDTIDTFGMIERNASVLRDVQEIADCETGFVFSGKSIVIILQNSFDPFEFRFREMFSSYRSLHDKVDRQVGWFWSMLKTLEKTGWIGEKR